MSTTHVSTGETEFTGLFKSSKSNPGGNCVKVSHGIQRWRKTHRCNHGECVKVGQGRRVIGIGDTTQDHRPAAQQEVLTVTPAAYAAFIADVKAGRCPS